MNNKDQIAIKVKNLQKTFVLPAEKTTSIKSAFLDLFNKSSYKKLDILKNINFEVKQGDFFGIVGKNGSGKSTLLKLLAGIYSPDLGEVTVVGKLTPFIELGVGFNPELTGKENVYLNCALLGMGRKQVSEIYQEIVDFSELHDFMDQKLKNYSSGMQVRLAFSIAVQSKNDIFLFDEVLAVGDISFQRKCYEKFEEYKKNKKTIILVTHDMNNIRRFCNKAILINQGKIIQAGDANSIAMGYDKLNQAYIENNTDSSLTENNDIKIYLESDKGKPLNNLATGDRAHIKVIWHNKAKVSNVGVAIIREDGEIIYGKNTFKEKNKFYIKEKEIIFEVKLNIGPGKYHLVCGLFGEESHDVIDFMQNGPEFVVDKKVNADWEGAVKLEGKWKKI